jgi:hypothetical protein
MAAVPRVRLSSRPEIVHLFGPEHDFYCDSKYLYYLWFESPAGRPLAVTGQGWMQFLVNDPSEIGGYSFCTVISRHQFLLEQHVMQHGFTKVMRAAGLTLPGVILPRGQKMARL